MMRTLLNLSSCLLLAACAPSAAETETQAAITNGSADSGDPAVALLHGESSDGSTFATCSGTFLAPNLLLTAAHCFEDTSFTFSVGTNESYDFTDGQAAGGLTSVASYVLDPAFDPTTALPHAHDLAVVHLSSNLGKATLPFHAGAIDTTFVGQAVHLVGYGLTSPNASDTGTRRSVDTTIAGITGSVLVITGGKQDCGGDSGGPALMTIGGVQTLVGVAESASTDCASAGYYDRIDGDIEFINDQLATSGTTGGSTTGGSTGGVQTGGCSTAGPGAPRFFAVFALLIALGLRRRTA